MDNFLINHKKAAIILLSSMYITGIVLLTQSTTRVFALTFTPSHLLLTTAILLAFHSHWQHQQVITLISFSVLFWMIEWIGVHTGLPFGAYHYGPVLGWQFNHIPLLIGLNWVIYLYAINATIQWLALPTVWRIMLGASLLVGLDFLIEPVAIHFNFWRWNTENGQPPLQNYLSWWLLSAAALSIFNARFKTPNAIAGIFLLWQFIFFATLNLINN